MSFVDVAQDVAPMTRMKLVRRRFVPRAPEGNALRLARPSPKTRPMIWFPAACVFYWGEITRNEILLDAARRDERRKIPLTASELARRVGLDTSDGREAARALVARGIWRRESDEFVPRARKELAGSYPDAGDFDVPILAEVAKKVWPRCQSALVIRAHLAVCWLQRARQHGMAVPERITSGGLAQLLGGPERSWRRALIKAGETGLIRRHDVRGWVETPWSDLAVSGQQDPEQAAICAPALRPSPPRAVANDTPAPNDGSATPTPGGPCHRTLSTHARDLPLEDLPPSHRSLRVGGSKEERDLGVPESWLTLARETFRDCWKPELALRNLVALGYAERDGCAYLRWISRQSALTYMEDHRALAVWCSVNRARPWLEKRRMLAASADGPASQPNRGTGVHEARPNREVIQGEGFRAAVNLIRRMRVA